MDSETTQQVDVISKYWNTVDLASIRVRSRIHLLIHRKQVSKQVSKSITMHSSVYQHDISKTDAARITGLGIEMFQDESRKHIYFWGRKVASHKNSGGVAECWLRLVLNCHQ